MELNLYAFVSTSTFNLINGAAGGCEVTKALQKENNFAGQIPTFSQTFLLSNQITHGHWLKSLFTLLFVGSLGRCKTADKKLCELVR